MEGFTPSVLMMIILAVIIGFAVGCFFMKQREKIKEAKKKLHTSEQEHEEDEDNEYEEEIMNIVNEGHEQGAIMEGEARMITNIFEFGDKDVTDVMTSRKKIDAIDVNMSVEKALNYMLDEPYSRYPLYEDDIDNIVGVLYLKDVIDAYLNQKEATLSDIAREPFFVHQTMNLSVLFQEMQTKKIHMAIVIDEYSQTEGIVSMEDMLEVIVGNILDEYDVEDRNITKIGWADIYLVRGSTRLEELEDTLGIEFDVEDIETLNGFLIDQLGHLPEDNEEIEIIYQGYSFKSVDIHEKKGKGRKKKMSGHSKFANIKHKKEKNDAKKGKIFTVIGREIAVAVKEGGPDPDNNSRLRDVIAKAKANNMPNDTIERGIKKAAGDADSVNYEQITYEGYGPSGVAIIVDTLTDNKNRTASNVRNAFTKGNGNVGTPGCVSYMFEKKGQIIISKEECEMDADDLMMMALDAGAEDFNEEDDSFEVLTTPEDFSAVREALEKEEIPMADASVTMIPGTMVELTSEEDIKSIQKTLDLLDEDDDVQEVYTNWDE